jgi:UDP-glucose 4-epimerase
MGSDSEKKSMRVLITGGCGFIGSNLADRLRRNAPDVAIRVFDNESLGKRAHLDDFQGEFVHGDLRAPAALDAALEGVDAVVHLAADTRVIESIEDPAKNFDVNVIGTFNLLEAMRRRGIRRLINASTGGAIIGEVEPPVHEEMVPRPMSPYGASKMMVEGYCSAYTASYGMHCLSLRFSNVYGPRSFHKGSVVAAFFKRILTGQPLTVYGDGTQVRDYIYVGDICDGIIKGLRSEASGAIQLGSGRPVTINELIDAIRGAVAPKPVVVDYQPFRAGEVYATWCDVSKARRELGFDPATPLSQGLAVAWDWFIESRKAG